MVDFRTLTEADPALAELIAMDVHRQNTHLHFIASENFVSRAVLEAAGSVFTNKYAEGYPNRRYYEGCEVVDELELLANERAKSLFGCEYVNVQPHSGAQANMAVYFALLEPGDTVMGMSLDQGGHLTHGSPVNFSGRLYNFVSYSLDPDTELIDMEKVDRLAQQHRPKILLAGYSAYSRSLDYRAFRSIADEVGAILMVDAAHFIGLVAGGAFPSPVPYADVVTATTHKALRGARGGMIMAKEELGKAINKALFPEVQGGSLYGQIAGKAACLLEAAQPEFKDYAKQVIANARTMSARFSQLGVRVVSGGTDNHLFLLDMRSLDEDLTGKEAARLLNDLGLTLNRNAIPFDPRPPFVTSGLRLGTPAATTQGLDAQDVTAAADLVVRALRNRDDESALAEVEEGFSELAAAHPPYPPDFPGFV